MDGLLHTWMDCMRVNEVHHGWLDASGWVKGRSCYKKASRKGKGETYWFKIDHRLNWMGGRH